MQVFNKIDKKLVEKEVVVKTWHPSIRWALKKLLHHEFKTMEVYTLEQFLQAITELNERIESLEEAIYYLEEE